MVYAANLKNPAIRHLSLSYLAFSFLVISLLKSVSEHGAGNDRQVLMVCVTWYCPKKVTGIELTCGSQQEFLMRFSLPKSIQNKYFVLMMFHGSILLYFY